ncbi:TIR domain-containing protein [Bordetella sp. LUAb4]|uniref:TIR domain-containing protein n=1 Tax=Bordetella sp. LUAb4 TaxID=2843195 RepID=UPI001E5E89AD|nr:TIR domain-containing protein [Bordetella sp. LUAb4]
MSEHQIFLSYGSPDLAQARTLYNRLKARGLNVWFDKEELLPGQRWDFEIKRALRQSDIVLFLVSSSSIERRGYVQREMKLAINHLEEKLPGDIYAIPILLDKGVKLEGPLSDIQYISANEAGFEDVLVSAIEKQLSNLGHDIAQTEEHQEVRMSKRQVRENWEGLPGYDVEYWLPQFQSNVYSSLQEITTLIESEFLAIRLAHRKQKLTQDTNVYHWSDPSYRRTNSFSANILEYRVVGRLLSIVFILDFYGAGAAHSNYGFKIFNFFLNPLCLIDNLRGVFADEEIAFPHLQKLIRESLKKSLLVDEGETGDAAFIEWITDGTSSWEDFRHFSFSDKSMSIHFPPYAVASFADGPQRAEIPLESIRHLLSRDVRGFLDMPM